MKKSIIFIGIASLMIACSSAEGENKAEEKKVDYPDVTVVTVGNETFEHYIKIQGVIETDNMVMVVPEVGGVITSLNVKEGQRITAGTIIASFDSRNITSNKEELQAQMEVAIIMRDKQQKLYDQGLGNIIQLEQAKGQVNSLDKAMNSLQVQGSKFSVKAPFTGIVEKVYVVKGEVAGPSSPIVMLVGEDGRKVVAKISETYLKNLNQGALVTVDFPVLDEKIDSLEVSRVGGFVDPINRTIDLEVNLPKFNLDKHVPNLMANINVRDKVIENALLLPSKVILKGAGQSSHVLVLTLSSENSNDTIKRYEVSKKEIEIGDMYEGKIIVTKGLNAGDIVIDRGRADVNVGNIVEISDL